MAEPLWTLDALLAATGGRLEGAPGAINGISIDTRTIERGDLFVALADARDGHEFVANAFAKGAAAALVREDWQAPAGCGALVRVADPLRALEALGRAARARTSAKIIAVTGSVGKTGTKEALKLCLTAQGATHASERSYNNHWGVPLTLARMPAATRNAVIEMGMNHAGEIAPLTRMARPHIAIVTTVAPVHIEFFPSEEAIADAKGEIFEGLDPGGIAVLNGDNRHYERLMAKALACGAARIVPFGEHQDAQSRLIRAEGDDTGSRVTASILGREVTYRIGAPGSHYVQNSLAVLAAVSLAGADVEAAAARLAEVRAPVGRGERTLYPLPGGPVLLIDESYNANPASVRAALEAMASTPRSAHPRRIAVLGDMRELGDRAPQLHKDLAGPVATAGVDLLFACGPNMAGLYALAPETIRAHYAPASGGLADALLAAVKPGDAVMIKGSLGTRMGPLVEALKAHLSALREGG
jgi:UDP-N-acetylmuramoyl-tripeptide--D-alanyl-D-alanine ligase